MMRLAVNSYNPFRERLLFENYIKTAQKIKIATSNILLSNEFNFSLWHVVCHKLQSFIPEHST